MAKRERFIRIKIPNDIYDTVEAVANRAGISDGEAASMMVTQFVEKNLIEMGLFVGDAWAMKLIPPEPSIESHPEQIREAAKP